MKYFATLVLGSMLISLPVSLASALSVGGDGVINIDAAVSGSAAATTSADVSGSGSASSGSSANGGTQASGSASTNVGVNVAPVILITRADLNAGSATQATVTSPSSVQSQSDLSAYASSVVGSDADADNAQLSDTAVSLSYQEPAKLFGFIPIFVQATATVNADGSTTVIYPWYAMFTANDSVSLQSDIQSATAGTISANTDTSFSAATQAQLLAQIHDTMKEHLQAGLTVETDTSASVQ